MRRARHDEIPIPASDLYPPFSIIHLSHVVFGMTDLAKSRHFYVETLGLQSTVEEDGVLYMRAMEERGHHCIVLVEAGTASARACTTRPSGSTSSTCAT